MAKCTHARTHVRVIEHHQRAHHFFAIMRIYRSVLLFRQFWARKKKVNNGGIILAQQSIKRHKSTDSTTQAQPSFFSLTPVSVFLRACVAPDIASHLIASHLRRGGVCMCVHNRRCHKHQKTKSLSVVPAMTMHLHQHQRVQFDRELLRQHS